jgi:chromosome segregation protein
MELYLKEIHLENFKSFGKKVVVPFFPGFTAITGPNGAGKSNIVDAILFVLGPKSSKVMRAGRLTDLIFNGGKVRKNPAKSCKVSLVFDNSSRKMPIDSDEVILTRMVRRAPLKEDPDNYYSYFYINGRAASLSEFEDLLTHARISGDGYNIVKQGDITNIIKMGSVERRKIIDDIAGISTFDSDIKKAEKEREEVERNLERIKIILNEINAQIRQLKKDRDAALHYKELKEKLYETKAKIAYKKKQEVENQIYEVNSQLLSYEKECKNLEKEKENLKKEYKELIKKLEEIEGKIAEEGETGNLKKKIDDLRAREIKIEEKIHYLKESILGLKKENREQASSLQSLEEPLNEKELDNEIQKIKDTLKEKEKSLSSFSADSLTQYLERISKQYSLEQEKIHELKLKKDRISEKIEALEVKIAEMEETRSTYEFELKDIEWYSREIKKEIEEQRRKIKNLEDKLFEKKKKESYLTEEFNDLDRVIKRLQREHSKLQAQLDALKSNRAVGAVLEARDRGDLKGIYGTIAELAQVEKKYTIPLEIAAGPRLYSIVTDNDANAAKAIDYLRKEGLGRATFLPLNRMIVGRPRAKALMAVKDKSSHGFALDVIKFKEEYRGAFWYVFGDTIIVDTLNDARRLMGGVRIVDMKGNLIEASGAMIGGSLPHLSFGDRERLNEVTSQLNSAVKRQDKVSEELSQIRKEIQEIESQIKSVDIKEVKDVDVRKKEFEGKIRILKKEIEEKENEKKILEQEREKIVSSIQSHELELEKLDQEREEKGKLSEDKKIRGLEKEVASLQETLYKLLSERQTILKKKELINERKKEILHRIKKNEEEIQSHEHSIRELKEEKAQCQNELRALIAVQDQMTNKVKRLTIERDKIYKKTISVENDLDKICTRIESYIDLISRTKFRLPSLEETLKELNQEMSLYNIEISGKLPGIDSLKESLRVVEKNMRELEPVNMRALEEYEHQSERQKRFMQDVFHLKNQRKNLIKLVKEIESKKKNRFMEVFNEINENFKKIYAELCEGGEAELILENEENIFEGGLTIKARPRGKKILHLSALSGGEKSIASLAFIFALQRYDPSPFYVLDEIDMFLDGVNAETVSRMIKKNAEHSQFINISLRKIVLKEANHVYGVTMHDSGISEMIGNVDIDSIGHKGEIRGVGA